MAQGILVRVILEGKEEAILCMEMRPDPMVKDHIILAGMRGLTVQKNLLVESLSVRSEDIKFYALVEPLSPPAVAPPAEPVAPTQPSNGGEAPAMKPVSDETLKKEMGERRKPGRPPKKITPQA